MARVLAIVNPRAGRGLGASLADGIARILHRAGHQCRIVLTRKAGEPRSVAGSADAHWSDGLLAVGGDGTVNEVINGRGDLPLPVGVVPLGTGNVLAKEIGVGTSIADLDAVMEPIARWQLASMDLAELHDGRRFSCMLSAGIEGRIVRDLMRARGAGVMRMSDYLPIGIRNLFAGSGESMNVSANGEPWQIALRHVTIANTHSFGGPMEWVSAARADDGQLNALGFAHDMRWMYAPLAGAAVMGVAAKVPGAKARKARAFRLEASGPAEVHYQIDGDYGGVLPVEMRVMPGALMVFSTGLVRGAQSLPGMLHQVLKSQSL